MKFLIEGGVRPDSSNPCYVQCPYCGETTDYWRTGANTANNERNIVTCLHCQKVLRVIGIGDGCLRVLSIDE